VSLATTLPGGKKGPSKIWLPIILGVGFVAGVILSFFVPERLPFAFYRYAPFELEWSIMFHVILSTISIALLISLVVIYLNMYSETGARFALGIVIVLFALLVQSFIQYPLFLGLVSQYPPGQGSFLSFADIFTIIAYTIFLYLSLE
jgi:heme/copper-type cytochrome/quinol oxidase subunit 4